MRWQIQSGVGRNPPRRATMPVKSGSDSPRSWNRRASVPAAAASGGSSGAFSTETPPVADASPAEANDVELLRKAADGDGRAFHALVDRHAQRLYRLAVSLVGSTADAEDVVQETFAGAFKGLRQFEG